MTMSENSPKKKAECPYCGDAPINHRLSYLESSVSMSLDPFFQSTARWIPQIAVDGAEEILKMIFHICRFFGLLRLSDDPERAVTLRSRVVWDEANRRGIPMRQVIVLGKPTDNFRARVNGRHIYFDSLPLPERPFYDKDNWDDKFFLKERFSKEGIPVPRCEGVPSSASGREELFSRLGKPIIVKPRVGSRGRHTTTNIGTLADFEKAVRLAKMICPRAVAEEHLDGYVCRATCVGGRLAGFYRAEAAGIIGDGKKKISELIAEKDEKRPERVERVRVDGEAEDRLARLGLRLGDVLPAGEEIRLSHRTGRLFGGATREMLPELHPSFIPILEKAARTTGLPVVGFDCIIPDPEADEKNQRWGIIEANTLPFIDLHYYALSGKPGNIAGMVWDLWK